MTHPRTRTHTHTQRACVHLYGDGRETKNHDAHEQCGAICQQLLKTDGEKEAPGEHPHARDRNQRN